MALGVDTVSYTHLDVYKRQPSGISGITDFDGKTYGAMLHLCSEGGKSAIFYQKRRASVDALAGVG